MTMLPAVKWKKSNMQKKRLSLHRFQILLFEFASPALNIVMWFASTSKGKAFVVDACKCH